MSALAAVLTLLEREQIGVALIGAAALAAHGVSRATVDFDLLTTEGRALTAELWRQAGYPFDVRTGDDDDPLAGIVRVRPPDDRQIDIVVGRFEWQRRLVAEASRVPLGGIGVPIVSAAGLILLKLYAGGSQDAWDIEQLLAAGDRDRLVTEVNGRLSDLPPPARSLWPRLLRSAI